MSVMIKSIKAPVDKHCHTSHTCLLLKVLFRKVCVAQQKYSGCCCGDAGRVNNLSCLRPQSGVWLAHGDTHGAAVHNIYTLSKYFLDIIYTEYTFTLSAHYLHNIYTLAINYLFTIYSIYINNIYKL